MTQFWLPPIGKYRHLAIDFGTSLGSKSTVAVGRPNNKQNCCKSGEECECEELRFRRGSPVIVCEVMGFASSSSYFVPACLV